MSKITDGPSAQANLVLKAEARELNFFYGAFQALKSINMPIYDKKVTALIGPSGCGKSTYLRCFNRMHDLYPGNRYEGEIRLQDLSTGCSPLLRSCRSRCSTGRRGRKQRSIRMPPQRAWCWW